MEQKPENLHKLDTLKNPAIVYNGFREGGSQIWIWSQLWPWVYGRYDKKKLEKYIGA